MSHTVILEFKCNEGVGPGFLEMLLGALADTRAFEGCENVETYTDADDPDRIVLWEKWPPVRIRRPTWPGAPRPGRASRR